MQLSSPIVLCSLVNSKMSTGKSFTFITRAAAYGSDRPRLCLDIALATSVFEQQVNYLFLDDGVYQLLANQDGAAIQNKTLGSAIETLELYGIEKILVDENSLRERHLQSEDLLLPIELVDEKSIGKLLDSSDYIFNL